MTISLDRPEPSETQVAEETTRGQNRGWKIAAIVLAVVALGLGVVVVSGVLAEDDPAAPEGVTQLLEDFEIAYETENGDLLRAIVTDDYFFSEDFYSPGGTTPDFSAGGPVDVVADFGETLKSVERSGDLIVSGEGPWIVAVAESWTPDQFNRTDGTAIYVMVDDEGTMKIDNYYFAGVRVDVQADFD